MATREGLYEALDRFRDALAAGGPGRVEWAPSLRYTENNVALEPGDGLWNTLTALGPYDLRFADASECQVALFTSVEEVQAVMRIANQFRVPVWPISRGKNLGYGGSARCFRAAWSWTSAA